MMVHHEAPPPPGAAADLAASIRARVPVIDTDRLHLRPPELGDFPVVADILASPRSEGMDGPMSREDAWYEFIQMTATWALRGHGYWTVTDRTSGEVLGFAGLGFEPGDREPELGYFLTEAAEGHGFASEAAAAIRDFGFGRLGLASMVSYIFRDNARSIALARRLGAVEDTPDDWHEPQSVVYRHPRPETRP